jgi:hypothetical protein
VTWFSGFSSKGPFAKTRRRWRCWRGKYNLFEALARVKLLLSKRRVNLLINREKFDTIVSEIFLGWVKIFLAFQSGL